MTESFGTHLNHEPSVNQSPLEADLLDVARPFAASSFAELDVDTSPCELATHSSLPSPCVRLDLEDLKCFEVVDQQFQGWGVTFSNAIALSPSNPAFPPHSGMMVLMGSPKDGWVEAIFENPVRYVSGFVTSSHRAVLAAFDANNQPIASTETTAGNLANSTSGLKPNIKLSLKAPNIRRVVFRSLDGHLTLDDFSFST